MFDCLQQGALDEVVPPKERRLVHARALRFRVSNAEQLAGVVPLVQSLGSIDAFEALESDERRVEHRGERLGCLRLANPCLSFQQQRLRQTDRTEQRRCQTFVGEVPLRGEPARELLRGGNDVSYGHDPRPTGRPTR